MKGMVLALAASIVIGVPGSARAQVQLSLSDGKVNLSATNATVRQILTEWARVGQTKIVNVERIPGGPLTLQLDDVPEAEALDLLLKSVTGYMAAPRAASAPNLSRYDRIFVLPTTAVARVPVAAPPPAVFEQPVMPQIDPSEQEASFPPRGPLFPSLQQAPQGIPMPQVVDDQGNIPAQMAPGMPGQPPGPTLSPGGTAVGTPRPGMVVQPQPPQPGGVVFPGMPPPPTLPDFPTEN